MSLFAIESLSFSYGRHAVLEDLQLSISEGEVVALLGANGSGKTTLLKLLLGLLEPSRGTVWFRGRKLSTFSRRELACELAYVPQSHREAFGYTVFDVALMGRSPHRSLLSRYSAHDEQIVWEALERIGIRHLARRPYTEVSGGERQLVLVARALVQQARVFIMDEPTTGLDFGNQVRLLERVGALAGEGYTFVLTSHHPEHAFSIADRVVTLSDGCILHDGEAAKTITPEQMAELYALPAGLLGTQTSPCGFPVLRQARH